MNRPDIPDERIWLESKAESVMVFLVDAPITFGHSQLWIRANTGAVEEQYFASTSKHIRKCIRGFRSTFSSFRFDRWKDLAEYTKTAGKYLKTLILKVSANEEADEYKIHLVPFFQSHLYAAEQRYSANMSLFPPAAGGLINWIGERERVVDYDMRFGREQKVVKDRVSSFRLEMLASKLRKAVSE